MERWQREHIDQNMSSLIELTIINPSLLAHLNDLGFSQYDIEVLHRKAAVHEQAYGLYEIAQMKVGAYDRLIIALHKNKMTAPMKILLDGYKEGTRPIPSEILKILDDCGGSQSSKVYTDDNPAKRKKLDDVKTQPESSTSKEALHPIIFQVQDYEFNVEELLGKYEVDNKIFTDESTKSHIFLVRGITLFQLQKLADNQIIGRSSTPHDHSKVRFVVLENFEDFKRISRTSQEPVHLIHFEDDKYFWINSSRNVYAIEKFFKATSYKSTLKILKPFHIEVYQLYQQIYDSIDNGVYQYNKPISLLKPNVSPEPIPPDYIRRKLQPFTDCESNAINLIDPVCFTHSSTETHIFLVRGVSLEELDEISGYEQTEISGRQLYDVTVRFIVLECEDDYERICKNTSEPVHVIEYKDNAFYWIKSNKQVELIRKFLKDGGETTLTEDEFIAKVESHSSKAYGIFSDVPELGKSSLMKNLSRKIQKPRRISILINLEEFQQKFEAPFSHSLSAGAILDIILEYICLDDCRKGILEKMLEIGGFQLVIFFDGYEKTCPESRNLLDSFLEYLGKMDNFIFSIFIAIPADLLPHLKNIFNLDLYKICPFKTKDLIKLKINIEDRNSKSCSSGFVPEDVALKWNIPTNPMEFKMLQKLMPEEHKSNIETNTERYNHLLFEMYKRTFNNRLGENEANRAFYKNIHIFNTIKSFFPEWIDKFGSSLGGTTTQFTDLDKDLDMKNPGCGEFLLTEFLVQNVCDVAGCVELITKIMGAGAGIPEKRKMSQDQVNAPCPEIVLFLNMHLRNLNYSNFHIKYKYKLDVHDVFTALVGVCTDDLNFCYEFLKNLLQHSDKSLRNWTELRDQWFEYLLYFFIDNSKNPKSQHKFGNKNLPMLSPEVELKLLKTVVELGVDINDISQLNGGTILHIPERNPTYFKDHYEDFLTWAIYKGFTRINDKDHWGRTPVMSYLGTFGTISREVLDRHFEAGANVDSEDIYGDTLLFYALHFNLGIEILKSIIDKGGNVNHRNHCGKNAAHKLLHMKRESEEVLEKLMLLKAMGFTLFNEGDENKFCPIHAVMKYVENLDSELLSFVHDSGCDFNALDERGWSVLFYAIWSRQSIEMISKIVQIGCNLCHQNAMKQNALHIAVMSNHFEATRYLIVEQYFDINLTDANSRKPQDYLDSKRKDLNPLFFELFNEKRKENVSSQTTESSKDDWKESHLLKSLPELIRETQLSPRFLAALSNKNFSEEDFQCLKAEVRPEAQAAKFFEIAKTKQNWYDELTVLFYEEEMWAPYRIFQQGYDNNSEPYPATVKRPVKKPLGDWIVGYQNGQLHPTVLENTMHKALSLPKFITWWRSIAIDLGIEKVDVIRIRKQINNETMDLTEILPELLKMWVAQKGGDAKLEDLVCALYENDLKNLAEEIKVEFCK